MLNLGRNELCWCGSGIKYKKCHLGRHLEDRPTIQDGKMLLKKLFGKKYCIHPESNQGKCKGNIVNAHTIQRSGGLSKIARKSHVYQIFPENNYIEKLVSYEPRLIGIKKASTFTGFCNYHDTITFKDIENKPFNSNDKQIFLLAYRALCKEVFLKKSHLDFLKSIKTQDKGLPEVNQIQFQESIKLMIHGCTLGVKTMENQKRKYDDILINENYSKMNYFIINIDSTPEFLCSGTVIPEIDFSGNMYRQLGNASIDQEIFTLSVIPTSNGGVIVFATHDNGIVSKNIIKSLNSLAVEKLPDAVLRFAFEYLENIYFSPFWWDDLNYDHKTNLLKRASSGTQPDSEHSKTCLLPDGFNYLNWNIENTSYSYTT